MFIPAYLKHLLLVNGTVLHLSLGILQKAKIDVIKRERIILAIFFKI